MLGVSVRYNTSSESNWLIKECSKEHYFSIVRLVQNKESELIPHILFPLKIQKRSYREMTLFCFLQSHLLHVFLIEPSVTKLISCCVKGKVHQKNLKKCGPHLLQQYRGMCFICETAEKFCQLLSFTCLFIDIEVSK